MPAEADKFLWDAKEAAARILRFTAGKNFDDYQADEILRAAVERQFMTRGEALNRLRQLDAALAGLITDLPRAVALRNVLVHAYAETDDVVVWGVVRGQLGTLLSELEKL